MSANQNKTLSEGWISFDSGDFESALKKATSALETSPKDKASRELESRATARLSKRKKPLGAAFVPVVATLAVALLVLFSILFYRQRADNYYSGILNECRLCLIDGDYDSALEKATIVLKECPNNERTLVPVAATLAVALLVLLSILFYRQRANNHYSRILNECRLCLIIGIYDSALRTAMIALKKRPNDERALELVRRAEDGKLSKLLSEGETSLENGDYDSARKNATTVLEARPNDGRALELKRRAEDAKLSKLLSEGETSLNKGGYELAHRNATTVLNARPNDERALELKRRAEDAKFSKLLSEGETCFENGNYVSAYRNATTVLEARPNDERACELERRARKALSPTGLHLWLPLSSREAGSRQTLRIGNSEFGSCWNAEYGFCWIPPGEFDMGSPETEKGRDDEKLHHVVLTRGFWALETEVTQALYRDILKTNPSYFIGDNLPVEHVSWDDAMKFCEELTKRLPKGLKATLPTEAQWEYMALAGTKTAYWYGDSPDSGKMNYNDNVGKTTHVKNYAPNPWGLYDMHGNVWEWCLDYYGDYPSGTVTDPKGPDSASSRVNRGGSWNDYARCCRSANRRGDSPDYRYSYLGFRFLLVCD